MASHSRREQQLRLLCSHTREDIHYFLEEEKSYHQAWKNAKQSLMTYQQKLRTLEKHVNGLQQKRLHFSNLRRQKEEELRDGEEQLLQLELKRLTSQEKDTMETQRSSTKGMCQICWEPVTEKAKLHPCRCPMCHSCAVEAAFSKGKCPNCKKDSFEIIYERETDGQTQSK